MLRNPAGWTPTSPTAAAPIPLPQFTPVAKDPLWPTDGREKCLNLTHEWVRPVHGTRQKYMMIILQPTKGVALKVRDELKSSKKHRVSGRTPCHLFVLKVAQD